MWIYERVNPKFLQSYFSIISIQMHWSCNFFFKSENRNLNFSLCLVSVHCFHKSNHDQITVAVSDAGITTTTSIGIAAIYQFIQFHCCKKKRKKKKITSRQLRDSLFQELRPLNKRLRNVSFEHWNKNFFFPIWLIPINKSNWSHKLLQ